MLVRVCRKGALIAEREYRGESRVDMSQLSKPASRHVVPIITHVSESISVRAASPINISSVVLICKEPSTDYFASVRAATHVGDEKDHDIADEDDLREEREDAGPSINEYPALQRILTKMDASDEEYTSDSDVSGRERERKWKSILCEPSGTEYQMMEKFRHRHDEKQAEQ